MLSFDLRRHRAVLCYLGAAIILFGLIVLAVDLLEGMPRLWSVWEGPFDVAFGVAILLLSRRVRLDTKGS